MNNQDPVENHSVPRPSGVAHQRKERRKGVNLLKFLLPGKLRGFSAIALAFLGVAGLSVVILFLVALIAFIVKRSGETADFLPTAIATPVYGERAATATFVPPILQLTTIFSSTSVPVVQPPGPSVTEQSVETETKWMKVTDTGSLGLRLRTGPGLDYETAGVFDEGAELRVIDGPQTADDIEWWKLESESGEMGWAAGNFLKPVDRAIDEVNQ